MTEQVLYEQGYLIEVSSYENDYDNRKTEILSGLSKEEADLMFKVATLFANDKYSNIYGYPKKDILNEIKLHAKAIFENTSFRGYEFDGTLDDYLEGLGECKHWLGLTETEGFWSRRTSNVQIIYIPERINVINVTDEFEPYKVITDENN